MPRDILSKTTIVEIPFSLPRMTSCKSLSTGQAQEVIGIRLRHGSNQARLPSHYLPIPLNKTDDYPYFMHPLLESELMLQKKEIPGRKTVKSDITQPLNFYFVIFTI